MKLDDKDFGEIIGDPRILAQDLPGRTIKSIKYDANSLTAEIWFTDGTALQILYNDLYNIVQLDLYVSPK